MSVAYIHSNSSSCFSGVSKVEVFIMAATTEPTALCTATSVADALSKQPVSHCVLSMVSSLDCLAHAPLLA